MVVPTRLLGAPIGREVCVSSMRIQRNFVLKCAEVGIWLLNTDIAYVGSMALYLFASEGISKRTFGFNHPSDAETL